MDRLGWGEGGSLGNGDQVGSFWHIQAIGSCGDMSLGQTHILFKDEVDSVCGGLEAPVGKERG